MKTPCIRYECQPAYVALGTAVPMKRNVHRTRPAIFVQLHERVADELHVQGLGQSTFKFVKWEDDASPLLVVGFRIGEHEHRILADIGDVTFQAAMSQSRASNEILLLFGTHNTPNPIRISLTFPSGLLDAISHFGAQAAQIKLPRRLADLLIVANQLGDLVGVPALSQTFIPKTTSIGLALTSMNSKLLQPVIEASGNQGHVFH